MAIERWLITLILIVSGKAWASFDDVDDCEAQLLLAYKMVGESHELQMFTPEDQRVLENALTHLAGKYLTLKGIAYRKSDEFQFEILPGEQSQLNRLAKRVHKMNQLRLMFSPVELTRDGASASFSLDENFIVLDLKTVIDDRVSSSLVHELRHFYAHVRSHGLPLARDVVGSKEGQLHDISKSLDLYIYRHMFTLSELYSYVGDARRALRGQPSPKEVERALKRLLFAQAFVYAAGNIMDSARGLSELVLPLHLAQHGQHHYLQLPFKYDNGELLHLEFAIPPSFLFGVTSRKKLSEYVRRRIDRHLEMLELVQFHLVKALVRLKDNGDIATTLYHLRKVEERLIQDLRGN